MNGRVIDGDTPLGHHLLEISQAQIIGQVPPHAEQDHRAIEVTAFEHRKPLELAAGIDRTELLNGLRRSLKDSTVKASGRDTIYDSSSRQKDKIDLRVIDANTKAKGNQAFKFIDKQDFHKKAGELCWEKVKSGVYLYGDVNGDGKADFSVFMKGISKLSKGDFFL